MIKSIVIFLLLIFYPVVAQSQDVMGLTWGMKKNEAKKLFKGKPLFGTIEEIRDGIFLGVDAKFFYHFTKDNKLTNVDIFLSDKNKDKLEKIRSSVVSEISSRYSQVDEVKFVNERTVVIIRNISVDKKNGFSLHYFDKKQFEIDIENNKKQFKNDIDSL